jgi:hypothetical protein
MPWKAEMKSRLNDLKLLIFLESVKPTADDTAFKIVHGDNEEARAAKRQALAEAEEAWEQKNWNVYYAISGRCCEHALEVVRSHEPDGIRAWKALLAEIEKEGMLKRHTLENVFYETKLLSGKNPSTTFFLPMENARRDLIAIGEHHPEEDMLRTTLAQIKVNDSYRAALMGSVTLEQSKGTLTYSVLKSYIIHHYESNKELMDFRAKEEEKKETALGTFHGKPKFGGKPKFRGPPHSGDDVLLCWYCEKPGHFKVNCPGWLAKQAKLAATLASKSHGHGGDYGPCTLCGEDHPVRLCPELPQASLIYRKSLAQGAGLRAAAAPTGKNKSKFRAKLDELVSMADQAEANHRANAATHQKKEKSGIALLAACQPSVADVSEEAAKAFTMPALTAAFKSILVLLVLFAVFFTPTRASESRRQTTGVGLARPSHRDGAFVGFTNGTMIGL